MKSKQTKPKYATFGKLVDELAKFDQKDLACIIASTDLGCPDKGENFIDGSAVEKVGVGNGVISIVCSDNGTMTWGQIRATLRDRITLSMVDQPAVVWIDYDDLKDANGKRCVPRRVKACDVIEGDDTIWNVELGPAV